MRVVVGVTMLLTAASGPLAAQRLSRMPVEAKNLVVQVLATGGDEEEVGAGIVVSTSDRIIIATAAHVVRTAQQGATIRVVFQFARNDTLQAKVEQVDRNLDLAVISVAPPSGAVQTFAFDRAGDPDGLEAGSFVVPVGCPERVCWEPPVSGDRVISAGERRVRFESFFVSPGSSGGALFNQQWEVVGLVTEKNSQDGVALGIAEVADRLHTWGYTVLLRPTSIPRAGYRTSFSLAGLAPSAGAITQSGRWPSGRLAVFFRGQQRIGWHVAALRLAPEDLQVTGGMVGTSVSLRASRFVIAPFGEVGAARVKGRFQAGSYTVQSGSGTTQVPVWQSLTSDVIGVGFGADLGVMLAPHIALTGVAGHWNFRTDAQLRSIPKAFAGAGLQYAF